MEIPKFRSWYSRSRKVDYVVDRNLIVLRKTELE
jgi:hypothetical protein